MKGSSHKSEMDRLSRIEGQVRGIKKMIEEERYCVDILIQVRSVTCALHKVRDGIFRRHLETCVSEAFHGNDPREQERKVNEIIELVAGSAKE